jgi:two-component system, NarL family, nitrate/nitrite response regulator NarL
MPSPINVIIADDHALFADGIRAILDQEQRIKVQHIASNGQELLDQLPLRQPELLLLDINMPILNGLEVTRRVKAMYPKVKVIIISSYTDAHLIAQAHHYGADGYLLKNCNRDELLQAIYRVMTGGITFPHPPAPKPDSDNTLLKQYNLTRREIEILHFISREYTNQQIAGQLHLSIYTIETHRKNIMQKLQLRTPAALTRFMLEKGL